MYPESKSQTKNPRDLKGTRASSYLRMQTNSPRRPDLNSTSCAEIELRMGGKDPTLVLYKKLTECDVDPSLGRVFLNNERLKKDLIPKMKKTDVSVLLDFKSDGLAVEAVDAEFRMYYVVIKRRDIDQFELGEEWKDIVEMNKLKEGDSICIWAFLCGDDGDLCLLVEVEVE